MYSTLNGQTDWILRYIKTYLFPHVTGVAQGIITGIRGLCNGLGPALYGIVFYLFHVDLNQSDDDISFEASKVHHHGKNATSRLEMPPAPNSLVRNGFRLCVTTVMETSVPNMDEKMRHQKLLSWQMPF